MQLSFCYAFVVDIKWVLIDMMKGFCMPITNSSLLDSSFEYITRDPCVFGLYFFFNKQAFE